MAVDDWFDAWLVDFLEMNERPYWPEPGTEKFTAIFPRWKNLFKRRGLHDREVAYEIAEELMADPPKFANEWLPAILKRSAAIYGERSAKLKGSDSSTREAARAAAANCPYCRAEGLTPVYNPAPDPTNGRPVALASYCVCAMGQWVEKLHKGQLPDVAKLIPKLADAMEGRSIMKAEPVGLVPVSSLRAVTRPGTAPLAAAGAIQRQMIEPLAQETRPREKPASRAPRPTAGPPRPGTRPAPKAPDGGGEPPF